MFMCLFLLTKQIKSESAWVQFSHVSCQLDKRDQFARIVTTVLGESGSSRCVVSGLGGGEMHVRRMPCPLPARNIAKQRKIESHTIGPSAKRSRISHTKAATKEAPQTMRRTSHVFRTSPQALPLRERGGHDSTLAIYHRDKERPSCKLRNSLGC